MWRKIYMRSFGNVCGCLFLVVVFVFCYQFSYIVSRRSGSGDKMKVNGIYLIENKVTGMCYIGSSRISNHKSSLKKGYHSNSLMREDYRNHGIVSFVFDILEVFDDAEHRWMEMYGGVDGVLMYNQKHVLTNKHSCITKDKIVHIKSSMYENVH